MSASRPTSAADRAAINARIDALLDGTLPPRDCRELFESLRGDPAGARDLAELRDTASRLSVAPDAPDLASCILARSHARRGFLSRRARRVLTFGRAAALAGVLAGIGVMAYVERHVPEARLANDPAPVANVADAAALGVDAGEGLIDSALASLSAHARQAEAPKPPPMRLDPSAFFAAAPRLEFTPGDAGAAPTLHADSASTPPAPLLTRVGGWLIVVREVPPVTDPTLDHDLPIAQE